MKPVPAPDPNPTEPDYLLPPGACDAHCHIYGPSDRFPFLPDRPYTPPDATYAQLRALHEHLGFERAVIVQAAPHGTDNRALLHAIALAKGACKGVAMVGPEVTDNELEALHRGGVRGIRYNFVRHLGGAPEIDGFERTIARIKALGWHAVLHFDAEDLLTHAGLLKRMPVPFIIDHMGRVKAAAGVAQKPFRMLLDLMQNPLAWVKVSGAERVSAAGPPFHDAIPFAQALLEVAPERVLFGTDWPHPDVRWMPDDGKLVDLFAMFCNDEALRHRVLVENPARLYWPT